VWQMVDEMLIAQAEWLPQYTKAIAEAKKRWKKGKLLPTKEGYKGSVRLHVKTVDEMKEEKGIK
jgi:alpha-galactosidase